MAGAGGSGHHPFGRLTRPLQILGLVALLLVNVHWARPFYNWDLLPYLAISYRFAGVPLQEAHERAYAAVREAVTPDEYRLLTEATEYRQTVARDPVAFGQQLPVYSVKSAYPLLISALDALGVSAVAASVWVSRVAYLGIGVVALLWLGAFLPPLAATATAWALMSVPFMLELARLSTPDALSTWMVLAALWLVFERRRFVPAAGLLILSMLARPDNLLWVLVIAGHGALRQSRRLAAAASTAAGVLLYLALVSASGYQGWKTLFHHAFIEKLSYPESFTPSLPLRGYLSVYLRTGHPINLPPFLMLVALVGVCVFVFRLRQYGRGDDGVALLIASGVFATLHWAVFPGEDRFFAAVYLSILILLVQTLVGDPRAPVPRGRVEPSAGERQIA